MLNDVKVSCKGPVEYSFETALEKIEETLKQTYNVSKRAIAILLLKEDQEIKELVREREPAVISRIEEITREVKVQLGQPVEYLVSVEQREEAGRIANKVLTCKEGGINLGERISRLTTNPITGLPLLFLILYWGLYRFVGEIGAGTVVDFIEGTVFEENINPLVSAFFNYIVPWETVRSLFVGEYGMLTLGIRYAVALILPIVTFFFLVFSVLEDSGYLPRLAMLIDRTFKWIGLSGRAVIPMVLGFGCDTMATMVTRTLPTKRERIISTMLLALAIPCSAQLGVILALLQGKLLSVIIWGGTVGFIFLFIGFLTARIMPGERPSFYMELPPLRFPKISNVLVKTYVRVKWYFKEIMPLFLLASVFMWVGQLTGLFDFILRLLKKPVQMIGLPPEAAKIFVFGFFRRDYGAAGLYDLNKEGALNDTQLVVACVALTLFLPCIAQLLMNLKERGWKTGIGISIFTLIAAYSAALTVNLILTGFGVLQ